MLWKLFVSLAAVLTPSEVKRQNAEPYLPYGPQSPQEQMEAYEALHGDQINGDMLFADDFPVDAGIRDTRFRWPGYPGRPEVPYVIDPALNDQKPLILQAMEHFHQKTCIKFIPKTEYDWDYIHIFKGKGCYSYVGKRRGGQSLSLGDGCYFIGSILHELAHAVGLFHEHQRSDRDNYITIFKDNIDKGHENNFELISPNAELIYTSYDYDSIMHYGDYAFSKQPKVLKTMEAKNGRPLLEPFDRPGFTNSDIEQLRKLYYCR
ncbi:hypothetical protein JTE90_014751 [Oedothorax gibbosus]|uniref:Metalloendopeptidase n=1 Tax=Oedothorax gibbosus TaxID=931172 RepID=A0AAV6UQI1_9ARAC|nr:hypothetical protein JTE90_014751 [Oedothorax gibbosus]